MDHDDHDEDDVDCGGGAGQAEGGGAQAPTHEVFGDPHLGVVMLFLLLLHLMQYAMRDPCTC